MYHSVTAVCLFLSTLTGSVSAQTEKPLAPPDAPASQPTQADDASSSRHNRAVERRPGWMPTYAGPWDAKIRAARSRDGREFKLATDDIVIYADAPTIARLPDDRLMVVFEHYPRDDRRAFGSLAAVFSADEGKTWTRRVALSVERLPRSLGQPNRPALAVAPNGIAHLAFTCKDRKGRRRCLLAESTDWAKDATRRPPRGKDWAGPHFKVLGPIEFDEENLQLDDLGFYYTGTECHITGTILGVAGTRYFGMYQGNRRFIRTTRASVADVGGRGSIVRTQDGLRSYATSPAGILSALSKDGVTWQRDKDLRLPVYRDPAVATLKDGTFLMLCVLPPPGVRGEGDIGETSNEHRRDASEQARVNDAEAPTEEWWDYDQPQDHPATDTANDSENDFAETAESPEEAEQNEGLADAEDFVDAAEADDAADETQAEVVADEQWSYQDFAYADLGVPIPDFHHKLDYRQWFQDRHDPNAVTDNAYDFYASLLLGPDGTPDSGDFVRSLQNMFGRRDPNRRVGPWDPDAHPDWDESSLRAADHLAIFRAAAERSEHVRPVMFADAPIDASAEDKAAADLLLNIMLPNLSIHRQMVHQTLSDAWRAPDGQVDSRVMIDAIDTSLSAADHIAQGDFLIEMLVAQAEQSAVEDTARRALANDLFTPEEMESVLEILVAKDREAQPASQWVAGELAACLDTTQYLFGPVKPDREPRLNIDRVKRLADDMNEGEWIMRLPTQEEIDTADGRQITDNFVDYYRRFGEMADRGYPEVTSKDLEALQQQYVNDNYVATIMLPSLSRVYDLSHRHEASRRATQLSYAIHLHKSRTGDWPNSLDDLDPRYRDGARTDPFTKQDFVYRRTADGFTLYTTSTNGRDDGGRHAPRWGDNQSSGNASGGNGSTSDESTDDESTSDDYVFWPPQE